MVEVGRCMVGVCFVGVCRGILEVVIGVVVVLFGRGRGFLVGGVWSRVWCCSLVYLVVGFFVVLFVVQYSGSWIWDVGWSSGIWGAGWVLEI